jgi:hypothetical protein
MQRKEQPTAANTDTKGKESLRNQTLPTRKKIKKKQTHPRTLIEWNKPAHARTLRSRVGFDSTSCMEVGIMNGGHQNNKGRMGGHGFQTISINRVFKWFVNLDLLLP